jgi:formylglycine-generating enzyme required for sulfatase activity
MAVWPDDRFQNGLEFQQALLEEDGQAGKTAPPPPSPPLPSPEEPASPPAPGEPKAKKKLWPLIGAAALVVLLALAGAFGPRYFGSAAVTLEREAASSGQDAQPEPTFTNSLGMEFVLIPAGEFLMGSPEADEDAYDDEKPQHRVTIGRPFYLGKYEVTQAQWRAVMGGNPSEFKGRPAHPVENVSWDDAQEFISRLNQKEGTNKYRLPTEAEWEYAARAGSTTVYSFGNDAAQLEQYAWWYGNSEEKTQPVGTKAPNAWGLYDMHGNVWEWVRDWYEERYYSSSPSTDPQGPLSGSDRVNRGCSWSGGAGDCRSAIRLYDSPDTRGSNLGFRLAFSPE